jgi:hypothetical protein
MSRANAFGRLFPAALFLILSVLMAVFWRSDPVLFGLAVCGGGVSAAWLVVTVVEVAKKMRVGP